MKQALYKIFALAAGLLLTLSCVEERLPLDTPSSSGGQTLLTFDFGSTESIQVETRSSVEHKYEMQVHNFYLFVFDENGAKVVGQYFDADNLKATTSELESTYDNCWYVSNATSDDFSTAEGKTTGTVRLKISSGNGMKIYMLANLDADMVRVSSDLLSATVSNEQDLLDFDVYMNQTIVTRNGYFPMYGVLKGVTIDETATSSTSSTTSVSTIKDSEGNTAVLQLKRIDAKVRFIFKTGTRADENGQTCATFEPLSWQVCNVPRRAYALGYSERNKTADCGEDFVSVDPEKTELSAESYSKYAANFFDTEPLTFETYTSSTQSEFTFYMMENRQKPKKSVEVKDAEGNVLSRESYQNRSRRIKYAQDSFSLNKEVTVNYVVDGKSYERTMRCFEYMNDFSTYVVVKGRVTMNLVNDSAGQTLGAEVTYLIPLGNWGSDISTSGKGDSNDTYTNYDDYNIIRNHYYTYTVTVNSVNNIRVEVESSKDGYEGGVVENQPGAYGDVTVAKEEIAVCDAHYVSKTLNFHLKNFFEGGQVKQKYDISDQLTWSVKTPFGEGEPRQDGGIDLKDNLDYTWVHFRLNKRGDDGKYFSNQRRKYITRPFESLTYERSASDNKEGDGVTDGLGGYHNDGIMDVVELVKYMKEQVERYLTHMEDPDAIASDFDNSPDSEGGPKISVTVFVDEYYYDKNPLTDEASTYLWKTFVNADDRKLHILCNSNLSKDRESRSTGSVITIQQRSIQCIFNTDASNTDLKTAWGVEDEDEFEKGLREKNSSTGKYTKSPYWSTYSSESRGNTDNFNGLLNTAKEWGLCNSSGSTFETGFEWGKYMSIEVNNDTPQLQDTYSYLRYSCMIRNRDNNGDGKIDRDELRWYTASIQQLIGMVVGKNLLNKSTQLYNRSPEEMASSEESVWQQHVASSTADNGNSNTPIIVWAEEGLSTGGYNSWNNITDYGSVRCVRNLGYLGDLSDETYDLSITPQNYVEASNSTDGILFDASNLNTKAIRYYTSKELPMHSETAPENQLYKQFEMKSGYETIDDSDQYKFVGFNNAVDEAIASGKSFCPEGWRVPNQIEMAVAFYYADQTTDTFCRTYFSFGPTSPYGGSNKNYDSSDDSKNKYGFKVKNNINVANNEDVTTFRCVRDIRVD